MATKVLIVILNVRITWTRTLYETTNIHNILNILQIINIKHNFSNYFLFYEFCLKFDLQNQIKFNIKNIFEI